MTHTSESRPRKANKNIFNEHNVCTDYFPHSTHNAQSKAQPPPTKDTTKKDSTSKAVIPEKQHPSKKGQPSATIPATQADSKKPKKEQEVAKATLPLLDSKPKTNSGQQEIHNTQVSHKVMKKNVPKASKLVSTKVTLESIAPVNKPAPASKRFAIVKPTNGSMDSASITSQKSAVVGHPTEKVAPLTGTNTPGRVNFKSSETSIMQQLEANYAKAKEMNAEPAAKGHIPSLEEKRSIVERVGFRQGRRETLTLASKHTLSLQDKNTLKRRLKDSGFDFEQQYGTTNANLDATAEIINIFTQKGYDEAVIAQTVMRVFELERNERFKEIRAKLVTDISEKTIDFSLAEFEKSNGLSRNVVYPWCTSQSKNSNKREACRRKKTVDELKMTDLLIGICEGKSFEEVMTTIADNGEEQSEAADNSEEKRNEPDATQDAPQDGENLTGNDEDDLNNGNKESANDEELPLRKDDDGDFSSTMNDTEEGDVEMLETAQDQPPVDELLTAPVCDAQSPLVASNTSCDDTGNTGNELAPQSGLKRKRPANVVVDPADFEAFLRWKESQKPRGTENTEE